ncbi:MAG: WD40 repeat protein [Verrucomicrobiales bacterium]|jgi:WD40 repeat protein
MSAKPITPYPGLRPFVAADAEVFCGRSDHRIDLLERLEVSGFLAVVGSSGSGKSSLVHAGLIPDIEERRLIRSITHERHYLSMRPGNHPFRALALALTDWAEDQQLLDAENLANMLRRGPEGLINFFRGLAETGENEHSVFLVVDQFEELFRFASATQHQRQIPGGAMNEAQAFVNLLLRTADADLDGVNLSVVITMRSDFVKDCEQFDGLPEAISRSQFLTPRLDREQLDEAMERPLRLFNASIQPELTRLILNELAPEQDQLPVIQHLLARMWESASKGRKTGSAIEITRKDYKAAGTLERALAEHRISAFASYGDDIGEGRDADRFFRCLAEFDPNGRLIRRPRSVRDIAEESGIPQSRVEEIAEIARADGCHFLMPPAPLPKGEKDPDDGLRGGMARVRREPMGSDIVLDLTHESLIRKWPKYREVMGVERAKRDAFLRVRQVMDGIEPDSDPKTEFDEQSGKEKLTIQVLFEWIGAGLTKILSMFNIHPLIPSWIRRDAKQQLLTKLRPTDAWAARYISSESEETKNPVEGAKWWESTEDFIVADQKRARLRRVIEVSAVLLILIGLALFSWRETANAAEQEKNVRQRLVAEETARRETQARLEFEESMGTLIEKAGAQSQAQIDELQKDLQLSEKIQKAVFTLIQKALKQDPLPWVGIKNWAESNQNEIEILLRERGEKAADPEQVEEALAFLESLVPSNQEDEPTLFKSLDFNRDGRVTRLEGDLHLGKFIKYDKNRDGIISIQSELLGIKSDAQIEFTPQRLTRENGEVPHPGGANGLVFTGKDALASWGADGYLRVWQIQSEGSSLVAEAKGSTSTITTASFGFGTDSSRISKERQGLRTRGQSVWFVTGSGGSSIRFFDLVGDWPNVKLAPGPEYEEETGHYDSITSLQTFNPLTNSKLGSGSWPMISTSVNNKIPAIFWKGVTSSGKTGDVIMTKESGPITSGQFSKNGSLILLSAEDSARLYSADSGKPIFIAVSGEFPVRRAIFRPDSAFPEMITPGGPDVNWWRWQPGSKLEKTEKPIASWDGHKAEIIEAKFSPEGTLLATGGADGQVMIWPIPPLWFLERRPDPVIPEIAKGGDGLAPAILSLAWSPDSTILAAGLADGRVLAWRIEGGVEPSLVEPIVIEARHKGPVWQVGFSPDGRFLASAGGFPEKLAIYLPESVRKNQRQKPDGLILVWEVTAK